MKNNDINMLIENGNELLLSMRSPNIKICEFNIFHSKEISISVKDDKQELFIKFYQSLYFKGNLFEWKNCDLKLSHKEELLNDFLMSNNKRKISFDVLKFEDLTSGFYIKGRYLSFHKMYNTIEYNNIIDNYILSIDETLRRGKELLSKWKNVTVQIWNSTKNLIIIRIEPDIIIINYLNSENKLKKGNIYIICHNPLFYCGSFMWYTETNFIIEYIDKKFRIRDSINGYCIDCEYIEFKENVDPVY